MCAAICSAGRERPAALAATACSDGLCRAVPAGIVARRSGRRRLLWRTLGTSCGRAAVWWVAAAVLCAARGARRRTSFAVRNEGWGTTEARLSLRYVCRQPSREWPLLSRGRAISRRRSRCWRMRRSLSRRAVPAGAPGAADLFRAVFRHRPAVLRRQLQLRRGCPVFADDLSAACDSRRVWAPAGCPAGIGRRTSRAGRAGSSPARWRSSSSWYLPLVRATTEEAWAARADVRFARVVAPGLPANSFVLTHNPGMFHVWGVNAGQMSHDRPTRYTLDHLSGRFAGGIYLHWNFWCNVQDRVQQEFCRLALSRGPATVVSEYRERDYRYALYRLGSPRSVAYKK